MKVCFTLFALLPSSPADYRSEQTFCEKVEKVFRRLGKPHWRVAIEIHPHFTLTFLFKYLVNFTKNSTLANVVQLMMR